jgi:hypothetical protein
VAVRPPVAAPGFVLAPAWLPVAGPGGCGRGATGGSGSSGARRRAAPAAAPARAMPLMRGDAHPAASVVRAQAGRPRRGDRTDVRRVGPARQGNGPARRGTGCPGRDRAGLAAPPPGASRPDAAALGTRRRPPRTARGPDGWAWTRAAAGGTSFHLVSQFSGDHRWPGQTWRGWWLPTDIPGWLNRTMG